jgi:hypothetical protein
MREHDIFSVVAAAVHTEIEQAVAALHAWPGEPPTPLLLGLCEGLRAQVTALRPPAG